MVNERLKSSVVRQDNCGLLRLGRVDLQLGALSLWTPWALYTTSFEQRKSSLQLFIDLLKQLDFHLNLVHLMTTLIWALMTTLIWARSPSGRRVIHTIVIKRVQWCWLLNQSSNLLGGFLLQRPVSCSKRLLGFFLGLCRGRLCLLILKWKSTTYLLFMRHVFKVCGGIFRVFPNLVVRVLDLHLIS